jgi:hypothetical protein
MICLLICLTAAVGEGGSTLTSRGQGSTGSPPKSIASPRFQNLMADLLKRRIERIDACLSRTQNPTQQERLIRVRRQLQLQLASLGKLNQRLFSRNTLARRSTPLNGFVSLRTYSHGRTGRPLTR